MRVLISGFEPFAGKDVNPTAVLIKALQRQELTLPKSIELYPILLPVTFSGAFTKLREALDEFNPEVVLAFGEANKRESIDFERVAINCRDAEIADNEGVLPRDQMVNPDGAPAYFSTLPLRRLMQALLDQGLPSRISNSAGTYVCNELFYRLMEMNEGTQTIAGFIHVPPLSVLSQEDLLKATSIMLKTLSS